MTKRGTGSLRLAVPKAWCAATRPGPANLRWEESARDLSFLGSIAEGFFQAPDVG